ncbi:hypothetical protein Q3G72_026228 [Acer saccharum]|nr:hypothetical protein Q3G72_026228 [Acer saccharum]
MVTKSSSKLPIEHSWIASLSLGAVFLNRQSSGYLHIDLDVSHDKTFATQQNLGVVKVNRESQAFLACPNLKKNQLIEKTVATTETATVGGDDDVNRDGDCHSSRRRQDIDDKSKIEKQTGNKRLEIEKIE